MSRVIYIWMRNNVGRFVDECGEVDCTGLAEAWDRECADGAQTLDPKHEAWDVAIDVANVVERTRRRHTAGAE